MFMIDLNLIIAVIYMLGLFGFFVLVFGLIFWKSFKRGFNKSKEQEEKQ